MNFFPSWIVVSSRRLSFFIFLLFFVGQISLLGNLNLTVKGSPASLDAWQNGSVTFTLSNDGSESISSIEISFDIASSKLKGGNEYQASQGTLNNSWTATPVWQVGNLSAGQSANLTLNIFSTTNGKIPISGKISAPANEKAEAVFVFNENGVSSSTSQPDLQLGNLNLQNNSSKQGQVLKYLIDLSNQSTDPVRGDFTVKSWISKDANLSNDDVQDGIIPTGNFGSNQTIEGVQAASTIPANLENGNYYLIVKIDADNSIEESNEDNNIISVPFSIGCEFPCPEITRISCGFKTVSEVSGFRPINSNHPILIETDSTFEVTYDARYYNTSMNFNVEKYTLSTTGNVLSASSSPKNFDVRAKIKVEGKNLVMVISDSLTANRVNIDYQYPNPQGIIIDEKPFKTSTGYAFGIALVKDRSGEILNRVIQTDHQGGNVRVTELPNPVFYSGFKDLEEGPDGTLYTKWIAPGNYTMYVVPADGSHARSSRIATDTPSTDWIDMRPTSDSSAVYTSKTDNLNAVITKHDSKVATVQTFDLTGFIGQGSPTGARQSRINGIMPTADGGVLAGATFFDRFDTGDVGNVIGKFDSEGNMLWRLELSDKDFKVSPIGETADRGALFGGLVRKDGQAQSVVFIKTTGDGKLMPSCMQ